MVHRQAYVGMTSQSRKHFVTGDFGLGQRRKLHASPINRTNDKQEVRHQHLSLQLTLASADTWDKEPPDCQSNPHKSERPLISSATQDVTTGTQHDSPQSPASLQTLAQEDHEDRPRKKGRLLKAFKEPQRVDIGRLLREKL